MVRSINYSFKHRIFLCMACYDPREFPRLAKKMGFHFNLRNDSIDWHKLGQVDVNKVVEECDLVTIRDNLLNIINIKVDDAKLVDLIKMFRLAQLSVNYLMYSEQHAFNYLQLAEQQMKNAAKEIQRLKEECKEKDFKLRKLKRKQEYRASEKYRTEYFSHELNCITCMPQKMFMCSICPKRFTSEDFLKAHCERRHGEQINMIPEPEMLKNYKNENERLHLQVTELQTRLNATEITVKDSQEAIKKLSLDVAALQQQLDIQENTWKTRLSVIESNHVREMEDALKSLSNKENEGISDLKLQLEDQETMWQLKLSSLHEEYNTKVEQLMETLSNKDEESTKLKSVHEEQVHIFKSEIDRLNEQLKQQGEYLEKLTEEVEKRKNVPEEQFENKDNTPQSGRIIPDHRGMFQLGSSFDRVDGNRKLTSNTDVIITDDLESYDKIHEKSKKSKPRNEKVEVTPPTRMYKRVSDIHSSRDSGLDSPNRVVKVTVHRNPSPSSQRLFTSDTQRENVSPFTRSHKCDSIEPESDTDIDSESENEDESDKDEESLSDLPNKQNVKKRHSLKEAVISKAQVVTALREDLKDILRKKMQELGVDPDWKKIPSATFKRNMSVLNHHQKIAAKKYKDYFKTRKSLEETVDAKVSKENSSRRKSFLSDKFTQKPLVKKVLGIKKQQSEKVLNHPVERTTRNKSISDIFTHEPPKSDEQVLGTSSNVLRTPVVIEASHNTDISPAPIDRQKKSVTFMNDTKKNENNSNDTGSQASLEQSMPEITYLPSTSFSEQAPTIRLKTKQSDKIAELCKSMEEQLQFVRHNKPAGGVETVFRKHIDSTDIPTTFNDSTKLNVSSNVKVHETEPRPKQGSSTSLQPPDSKTLTLSEWDLNSWDEDES